MFSVHWPRPFSALFDERHPEKAAARYAPCQEDRCVDKLDNLSKLKLCDYKRTDNAFCGAGSDPYGCLGESKQAALMAQTGSPMHYHDNGMQNIVYMEPEVEVEVEAGSVRTAGYQTLSELDSIGNRIGEFGWPR